MFMDRFFVSKKLDQTDPAFDYSFILIGILGLESHRLNALVYLHF